MARTPPVRREQPVELAVELVVRGAVASDDAAAARDCIAAPARYVDRQVLAARLALLFPPGSVLAEMHVLDHYGLVHAS